MPLGEKRSGLWSNNRKITRFYAYEITLTWCNTKKKGTIYWMNLQKSLSMPRIENITLSEKSGRLSWWCSLKYFDKSLLSNCTSKQPILNFTPNFGEIYTRRQSLQERALTFDSSTLMGRFNRYCPEWASSTSSSFTMLKLLFSITCILIKDTLKSTFTEQFVPPSITWTLNPSIIISPRIGLYLKEIGQEVLLKRVNFLRWEVLLLQLFSTMHRIKESKQFLQKYQSEWIKHHWSTEDPRDGCKHQLKRTNTVYV